MPTFQLKPGLLTEPVSINLTGTSPSLNRIISNQPPGSDPVVVASANIAVTGGDTIRFNSGSTGVTFHADANAKLEILPGPANVAAEITTGLDLAEQLAPALMFPSAAGTHYGLLRWGYDAGASANGSVALGRGATVSFAGNASSGGLFAVVRQIPDGPGCDDIIRDVISSWRLPKQVTTIDDIAPGTWIIAETNGAAGWSVQASYGYNLNWIRKVTAGTLAGDIGLKVQIGLAANIGFNISGKHAVVLSRGTGDEENQIRFRLYRMKVRNWDVGFSAKAEAQAVNSLLPESFDDLIAGAFGVTGTKIVKALQDIDSWTKPGQPLFGPLAGVSEKYLEGFFRSVTGVDINSEFSALKNKFQALFSTWDALPQAAAKLIWSHLPDGDAIESIAALANRIASADRSNLSTLLTDLLKNAPFFATPAGKWLESLTSESLFTALNMAGELSRIQSFAADVQKILDGGEQQGFLTRLHDQIAKRLDLAQIGTAANSSSAASLDEWLAKKLEAFLGQTSAVTLEQLKNLRDQIHKLAGMRNTIYAKALEALQHKYDFSLSATYQNTATTTALIDAVFDFSGDNAGDAAACLQSALEGRLDDLLGEHPGVTLNQGVLTHGVRRQSTVELTLPFYKETETHVNDVLASITAIDHGEGRLLAVKATDTVSISKGRNQRNSSLTRSLSLAAAGKTGVVIHDAPSAMCSYSLTDTFDKLSRNRFLARYQPEIETYFATLDVNQWIDQLIGAGNIEFGKGTVTLEVTTPPSAVLAWMKAPAEKNAPVYKEMAGRMVGKYRTLLLRQYFANTDNYGLVGVQSPTFALLAYSCVLPFASGGSSDLYWNWPDRDLRNAMLRSDQTKTRLKTRLASIQALLAAEGNSNANRFAADQMDFIISCAVDRLDTANLFQVEAEMVENARSAGLKIAQFLLSEGTARDVYDQLEAFGSKLTDTFNKGLENWAVDALLLPLGSMLLIEAARAFDNVAANTPPNAMFTVNAGKLAAPQRLTAIAPSAVTAV